MTSLSRGLSSVEDRPWARGWRQHRLFATNRHTMLTIHERTHQGIQDQPISPWSHNHNWGNPLQDMRSQCLKRIPRSTSSKRWPTIYPCLWETTFETIFNQQNSQTAHSSRVYCFKVRRSQFQNRGSNNGSRGKITPMINQNIGQVVARLLRTLHTDTSIYVIQSISHAGQY